METKSPKYSRSVMRLLEDENLEGLLALLRQPDRADLRGEAALALGELGNFEATELLVRATREDPEARVRAAAQQAMEKLFGGEAGNVSASYSGAAEQEPWLVEPTESGAEDDPVGDVTADEQEFEPAISDIELEGFVRVARYESNERLRLRALRILGKNPGPAVTDVLAELALWGDSGKIRQGARQALENVYGDAFEEILENYRAAALAEARNSGTEEQLLEKMELEYETSGEDDEDEEWDDESDEEWDEDDYEEDDDDSEEEDQSEVIARQAAAGAAGQPPYSPAARPPSPYLNASNLPVAEEVGRPWWLVGVLVIGLAILLFVLLSGR